MIILGFGSNLSSLYGDRFKNIDLAIENLEFYKIHVLKKSSFYETPSYPNIKNPMFINRVILVDTHLGALDLMSVLLFIEKKLGRVRSKKNDPRICDIDIIDYKSELISFNYDNLNFTAPHKKLKERNFVLYPLQELLPDWCHPETNEHITVLINKLSVVDKNSILKVKNN